MKRKQLLNLLVGVTMVAVTAVAVPLASGCRAPAAPTTPPVGE